MVLKLKVAEKENDYIVVEIKYNLGGYNWGTGRNENRGYYVYVTPKEITEEYEKFGAFTGYKDFIHEVKRKSEKAYVEAVRLAIEENETYIRNMVRAIAIQEKITDIQGMCDRAIEGMKKHYEVITND